MTRIQQARELNVTRRQVVKIEQKRITLDQAHQTNQNLGRNNPPNHPTTVGNPTDVSSPKRRKRKPMNKLRA